MNFVERLQLSVRLSMIPDDDERLARARDAMEEMGRGIFLDERDGQLYPFARFGDAERTLRNLNFAGVDGAIAWGDDSENRYQSEEQNVQHGLLYPFEVARLAVPAGWRLPTDQDWQALIKPMGGFNQDGQPAVPTAEDAYLTLRSQKPDRFAGMVSGWFDHTDQWFHNRGTYGHYWADEPVMTMPSHPRARCYTLNDLRADVRRGARHVADGASVRLVRDAVD